jgi:protocatechuate 3,4-dioxygenase alpha subunit
VDQLRKTTVPSKPIPSQTPSQTIGPFFAQGLTAAQSDYPFDSIIDNTISGPGQVVHIQGRVFDGEGKAADDAMIEIWQADCNGQYDQENFCGYARCGTGYRDDLHFSFKTIKPGSCVADQAPYITVIVFMRGLMTHAFTRLYFDDEAEANARDFIFQQLPEDRKTSLIAMGIEGEEGLTYVFDIHMQGADETLFFDI